MAGKVILFINLFVSLLFQSYPVESSKLNVPRVLLPIFNQFSINFTLEVTEGGCYRWTTSRLDIVQLIPVYDDPEQECSSRAIVSSISKEATRNTAIVLAEEEHTGQVLRCDVIVDVIYHLDIVTTTRELYMEEAPEAFEVRSYDDQGNEFTTLENVQFDWKITYTGSDNTGNDINVLRFMTFRDSPYETPKSVQAFEELGLRGHIALLEGVKTGSAKVSVKLPYPEYHNVPAAEVSLMVVANLIIVPADVYIIRGDTINYKIIQVKHGRLEEIELSTSQYYLRVEDSNIGKVDESTGYLTGLDMGKTRVILHDRNVDLQSEAGLKLPSTTVHVTYPSRISLSILPHHNWAILTNENHQIIVEAFAKNDHKIYLGNGVQFQTIINENLFPVTSKSSNGSWLSGYSKTEGIAQVTSKLISLTSPKLGTVYLEPILTVTNEILIFPEIVLYPKEVIFPWDPIVQPKYEYQLRASGGDGKYIWSSTNHSVGTVSQSGLIRTFSHGQYGVCASMSRNPMNKKCTQVYIIPPSKLEIVEYIMENEIGLPIFLHVALYAERPGPSKVLIPFTECNKLNLKVKPIEHNFIYNKTATTQPVGISCKTIGVIGLSIGTSKITISYQDEVSLLEDYATISAYRPLQVLYPETGQSVLALGTSRNIVFAGGPRPWMGHSSNHFYKLDTTVNPIVSVVDKTNVYQEGIDSDTYVVHVLCNEMGMSQISLTVGNKPLFNNCKHQASVATATVYCSVPNSIHLHPTITMHGGESCPMDLSAERVVVQSYRNIHLDVKVKDEVGRTFDNITSLQFDWKLNPITLGSTTVYPNVVAKDFNFNGIILPERYYQVLVPQAQAGMLEVMANVDGYLMEVLNEVDVKLKEIKKPLQTKLSLYLVDDTIVSPNVTSIYNHPENKRYLFVKQGSGFYELSLSSDKFADVKYIEAKRQIEIVPRNNGELRVGLSDLCLKSNPALITIRIVSVASLLVEIPDKVEIGKSVRAIAKFFDESNNIMPLPKLEYLDIRYIMEQDVVNINLMDEDPKKPWSVGEVHYLVRGIELGDTQLVFAAGRGDKEVVSTPVSIQVFSPIKIIPRNVTIFIGAQLQLVIHGGPQPDANIEYVINQEKVLEVNSNGLIKGLNIGTSTITARSTGVCPSTGEKIIHGQDTIEVHVIPLNGLKIVIPLTRFMVGTTVPAWVTGLPELLSPILLGSVQPPLLMQWSNTCEDIIDIHGIFRDVGIRHSISEDITVRLKGVKTGKCTLGLKAFIPGSMAGKSSREVKLGATVDLEVFEELTLIEPQHQCTKTLLLAPYSSTQLKMNMDGRSTLSYSLQDEFSNEEKSITVPNNLVTVSETGLLQSYGVIGRAMVIITSVDDQGLKQSVTFVVQVKSIHYIMTNMESDWMISEPIVNYIPLGAELQLKISYHDNTGKEFNAATVDLKYRSNRFDLIDVKRSAFGFNSCIIKQGSTMVKVWVDGTQKPVDYVNIITGKVLKPNIDTLVTGDVFCLYSPVVDKSWKSGKWYSDDYETVRIDPDTGIGQAVSFTSAQAAITYSLTPAIKYHFNIEPVKEVVIKFDHNKIISNTEEPITVEFLLIGSTTKINKKNNFIYSWDCSNEVENFIDYFPFKCEIFFTNPKINTYDVFEAKPSFNKNTGLFSCNIIRRAHVTPNISIIQSNLTLFVLLNNGIESERIDFVFKPAFYITNEELILSDSNYQTSLTIIGSPDVLEQLEVVPMDKNFLSVDKPSASGANTINYDIHLIDYHWKFQDLQYPLSVNIISKLTNQNVRVDVKTHLGQDFNTRSLCYAQQLGSPTGNFFYQYRHVVTIVLAVLILFFVTVYSYAHYIQPTINVNVEPQRTLLQSTLGSPRGGSPVMLHSTPTAKFSPPINRTYCSPNSFTNLNNRSLNMSGNSSTASRYIGEIPTDLDNFNLSDIRRNRRFL